jgi:phosphonopyruvate decarboxylase
MISPEFFVSYLQKMDINFFAGVPDSLLKSFCAYISDNYDNRHNIIASNEGGAMGIAAGYHLATSKVPVVYMQNSGEGNIINPLASLIDKEVYNIPVLLIIGWRGEPGVKDEPQHKKQGKVTLSLLDAMEIRHAVLSSDESSAISDINYAVDYIHSTNEPFALIVRKDTFDSYTLQNNGVSYLTLSREDAIKIIASSLDNEDIVVSTTGMISRELFEYRESANDGHGRDFLTVGSMGHASQIALGIALHKPNRRVFCFDGDGAAIMHLGSMAITASLEPFNYYHIVFNNGAHDSVGGQPTVGLKIDLPSVAKSLGYKTCLSVDNMEKLTEVLPSLAQCPCPLLLEIKVKKGNRKDLGRPTTTPIENKIAFMDNLNKNGNN